MRVLIITGVGRSGTSILGKIIGSMSRCYYVFEPAIMKFPSLWENREHFLRVLYEDYLLPVVQGRGNANPNDLSYMGHYDTRTEYRWEHLHRKEVAQRFCAAEDPLWVIKTNEFQPYMDRWLQILPSTWYIHIVRNGLDTVRSMVSQGWYTDQYCNERIVDVVDTQHKVYVPHFISEDEHKNWQRYSAATRAACAWRNLATHINAKPIVYFEDLCSEPYKTVKEIPMPSMHQNALTWHHLDNVKKPKPKHGINLNDIQSPEKEKFIEANERLGYNLH